LVVNTPRKTIWITSDSMHLWLPSKLHLVTFWSIDKRNRMKLLTNSKSITLLSSARPKFLDSH
jgi:hypothetical protein